MQSLPKKTINEESLEREIEDRRNKMEEDPKYISNEILF